jgi:hypothetical protein
LQSDYTGVLVCRRIPLQCLISFAAVGSSCRPFILKSDSTAIVYSSFAGRSLCNIFCLAFLSHCSCC